jgi:3-oxoacyl-[acyl-carrier protein] reductase
VVEADVTSRESVEKMVNAAVSKFGRVDLMVNNAGITSRDYSIVDLKEAESTRVMGVNLNGPLNCMSRNPTYDEKKVRKNY